MNTEITIVIMQLLIAFLACLSFTGWWIRVAKENKLVGKDMNKSKKPLVAEAGGIAVIISIILSLLIYIFFKTFILETDSNILNVSIIIITLILACFIGFIDDILGWKKGLKQWQKLLMTLPIAIPLIVINAGHHSMVLPFFGNFNFGLFYPLLFIPLAVMGTTNGYNILAGYNGLEASLGAVIFGALGVISILTGQMWLALIAGIVFMALLAFLFFNIYPSKVFPGDSLTYPIGALIACFAVIGNVEKIALILFIPFIIEGVLKLRSRLRAENFGLPNKDNSLNQPYKEVYSLTHLAIKILKKIKPSHKAYEKEVVLIIVGLELVLAAVAIIPLL